MKYWRKYHPTISADDPRYHQVSLIYSVLLIMLIYFGLIGLLNITLFDAADIAVYDFSGFALAAAIYFYVSRGGNFKVAGWIVTLTLVFVLLAFIHLAEGRNYSLLWVTILPPIAFFLLGPTAGTWVTGLVFAYCGWFLYKLLGQGIPGNLSLGAFFNFAEVATAQIFLFRYYERSRREAYEQLQKTSVTDPLTGIFNRLHLDNTLKTLLAVSKRDAQPTSVLLLDVDHFKRINDEYGHIAGDKVLVAIARIMTEATRDGDLVGRWGGEEFLIICPKTDATQAAHIADRVVEKLNSQTLLDDINATVSIGIATASGSNESDTAETLLQTADKNLYQAKADGRNTVVANWDASI
ncbi:GGDEF domain-containing protein [Idiomarina sp. HP20-50]|uniref:GGDEF domain-containing protein n=1 Tax=Idiomarina sp. HP20-50 TaxID=3070813 RepID=UPI00294B0466|nr:GGDEF domain-containing protein [Idiomarina sp. HP20-50]MDV6316699.1 GGDEF domain-containing protein [Idiomarina sp. HP20-50]